MSDYDEGHPVKAWQRDAAAREIERLIKNPPVQKPETAVEINDREVVQWKEASSKALETLMDLAVKKTGKSREWIMSQWGKEEQAPELSRQVAPRSLQVQRARMAKCPDLYRDAVIARDPIDCQALKAVKKFLAGRRRLLMMTGGKGTWKSGSACYAIGQVEGSRYVFAPELDDVYRNQRERWMSLLGGTLVVLDDLGREDQRDGERPKFLKPWTLLVENAYAHGKRLIVTGNVTWPDFKRAEVNGGYGVLAADRWDEAGVWEIIGGESKRREMRNSTHWANQGDENDDGGDD